MGMDASRQAEVDDVIIKLDGTPTKERLGGNATGSVSAAVLQAGAASVGIPLYQHIGGVNANLLPVPGIITVIGSSRYGSGARSGGKPSYSMMCYGFNSFSEAAYAAWEASKEFCALIKRKCGVDSHNGIVLVQPGVVEHDRQLWDLMVEAIQNTGYEGKIGLQVDVAAGTYFDKEKGRFVGLFSAGEKDNDDLLKLYQEMVRNYPFVIIEDPMDEDDYEGHAVVTKELGIAVVGDDLFTTNIERLKQGLARGAANTVLLKVNQIGTISEAFETVQMAYRHGYGVMPCDSRGEGALIADYAVGLGTGHLREGALGPVGNRFLQIEADLGSRARFLGRQGFKGG
jgi:enolase